LGPDRQVTLPVDLLSWGQTDKSLYLWTCLVGARQTSHSTCGPTQLGPDRQVTLPVDLHSWGQTDKSLYLWTYTGGARQTSHSTCGPSGDKAISASTWPYRRLPKFKLHVHCSLIIFKPAPCLLCACLPACYNVHSLLHDILYHSFLYS
jgi:hypothetical protein